MLSRADELETICERLADLERRLAALEGGSDRRSTRDRFSELTETERRIVGLVVAGRTNDEVAQQLLLSPKTVEWSLTKVYRKLRVRSRTELAAKLGSGETPCSEERTEGIMLKGLRRRGARTPLTTSLAVSLALLFALGTAGTASGLLPPDPIDPPPIPGVPEPDFARPAGGFDWSVPSRFGRPDSRGIVDFHWNSLEGPRKWDGPAETYDPTYVHPSSFPANFDGCPTAAEQEKAGNDEPTDNTYVWTFANPGVAGGTASVSGRDCMIPYDGWTAEGEYSVKLAIQNPDGTPFEGRAEPYEQTVRINDLLIVSIGDSYGSGEGNPDKPAVVDRREIFPLNEPAVWQDRRCHRSAYAGPAQAALFLEATDPHSSVTFLSFACSGATINTPHFDDAAALDPYRPGDPTKPIGTGVLGSYLGLEPFSAGEYGPFDADAYREQNKVPSQIAQLKDAVRQSSGSNRRIDALIVSGGGNDLEFSPIASICTLYYSCQQHFVWGRLGEGLRQLQQRLAQDLDALHPRFDALDAALENPDNGFDIGKVYATEYPDPTRDDHGAPCGDMLEDVFPLWMAPVLAVQAALPPGFVVPLPPYRVDAAEAQWASTDVLGRPNEGGLNGAVYAATQRHGWTYVDGVSALFAGPGYGHGYCAQNSWIRRAFDSTTLQGPVKTVDVIPPDTTQTTGTLHPTARGHLAYAKRIHHYLRADLLGQSAQPPQAPEITPSPQAVGSTARQGDNGWLTGRCADGVCTSDFAVAAVEATHPSGIRGVSLSVNGVPGCTAGATCTTSTTTTNGSITRYRWEFQFAVDGVYRLEFTVSGADGASDTFRMEVKVDLHDPAGVSATPIAAVEPSAGWYRVPVDVRLGGTDAGSGIAAVEYDLDGGGFIRGGDGETIALTGDGVHSLTVRSVDWAGRKSAAITTTIQVDRTPPAVDCEAADGAWHANDVSLGCTATDADSGFARASDDAFSLATSVSAGTETADAATEIREVCDVAGNCATAGPIGGNKVDRKAPAISITAPTATGYPLSQAVAAGYTCEDGGSGMGTCTGPVASGTNVDTASVGAKTFTVDAMDAVGNSTGTSVAYQVNYVFTGFFFPVANPPALNAYTAGWIVPIRFSLAGNQGLDVLATGYPKSAQVSCTAPGSVDGTDPTLTPFGISIVYVGLLNQYGYGWQTNRAWRGTCRQFVLRLKDGAVYRANFRFS